MSKLYVNNLLANSGDVLSVTGSVSGSGFINALGFANRVWYDTDTVIPRNSNALLFGPITISESITIQSGSALKIRDLSDWG